VKFNGSATPAAVTGSDSTSITTTVPAAATSGSLTVTTLGGTATRAFKVKPLVGTVTPSTATVGTTITITGTTFVGVTSVTVNGVAATPVTVVNPTTITTKVPATATTGPLVVTTAGGASLPSPFTVTPAVTTLNPTSGATGSTITINGSGFRGTPTVAFGSTLSPSVTQVTATSLKAVVPDGASTSTVHVTTDDAIADGPTFTVSFGITSISPTSGPAGTQVAITGSGFLSTTSVKFGGATAGNVTLNSATSITATVPVDAVTGKVTLTNGAVTVQSVDPFTVASVIVAAEKIVFARTNCGTVSECGIWAMNGAGNGLTQLTQDSATAEDRLPQLSADGTKIVFVRIDGSDNHTIWKMGSDGSSPTQLTTGDQPAWSPNGSTIAFVADDANPADPDFPGSVIWTIGSNGTGRTQITDESTGDYKSPKWAPTGSKLAFVRDPSDGTNRIETLSPVSSGTSAVQVVSKNDSVRTVEWSPDGSKLLYTQFGSSPLHIIDAVENGGHDGPGSTDAFATHPSWTHCSRIVVDGIAVMLDNGTGRTVLTGTAADVEPSCWEPSS
jgi:hypothetical protein